MWEVWCDTMQTSQIGKAYIPGQVNLEEKTRYRLDNEGHSLLLVKAAVSQQEISNMQNAAVELALYIDGPIIFLLFKFGTSKWNEAAFSWHTVPAGIRVYPEEAIANDRLKVTLVEATDGCIKAAREIIFTSDFADKLNQAVTNQANCSFNGLSYAKHINLVYNQYEAEDMAALAVAHMSYSVCSLP